MVALTGGNPTEAGGARRSHEKPGKSYGRIFAAKVLEALAVKEVPKGLCWVRFAREADAVAAIRRFDERGFAGQRVVASLTQTGRSAVLVS